MFLALGLGMLVGTTVLNDSLVEGLRARQETLQQQASDLREQLGDTSQELAAFERFATDLQPIVLPNRLPLQPVILVTADGVDADALDESLTALDMSGARVVTTITVQTAMTSAGGSDAQALAELLGVATDATQEELMAAAADGLAARLAVGPGRSADPQDDLLGGLLNAGFVVAPGLSDADLADVGGPDQAVVVVGGGPSPAQVPGGALLASLVARLVDLEMVTVAAESSDPDSAFVTAVRDLTGSAALVTVDGLDRALGGTALVLGIDSALLTGEGGAWGIGDQATDPLPPPPAA